MDEHWGLYYATWTKSEKHKVCMTSLCEDLQINVRSTNKFIKTEERLVAARSKEWGWEMGERKNLKVETSSYKHSYVLGM